MSDNCEARYVGIAAHTHACERVYRHAGSHRCGDCGMDWPDVAVTATPPAPGSGGGLRDGVRHFERQPMDEERLARIERMDHSFMREQLAVALHEVCQELRHMRSQALRASQGEDTRLTMGSRSVGLRRRYGLAVIVLAGVADSLGSLVLRALHNRPDEDTPEWRSILHDLRCDAAKKANEILLLRRACTDFDQELAAASPSPRTDDRDG